MVEWKLPSDFVVICYTGPAS